MTGSRTRVLVLGATGMLGHKVCQVLDSRFDVVATTRNAAGTARYRGVLEPDRVLPGVTAEDFDSIVRACADARPTVIVNCVGIVKQRKEASDPAPAILINALFPHRLATLARGLGSRVIHISTDCVFAGTRGGYTEADTPDATDLYGRTKLLGELAGPSCLTLRTSIIGRELSATTGLLEWFLAQRGGRVRGFMHARFSGVTTATLARIIGDLIEQHPGLAGVYHVASTPVSKYDLLCLVRDVLALDVQVDPDEGLRIDRSLDGSRFVAATGSHVPGWDTMIGDLASDPTPYEDWRRQ